MRSTRRGGTLPGRIGSDPGPAPLRCRPDRVAGLVARWLLLGAVIAGIISVARADGRERPQRARRISSPAITAAEPIRGAGAGRSPARSGRRRAPRWYRPLAVFDDPISVTGTAADLSGCILFLVVTAAAVGCCLLVLHADGKVDGRPARPTGDAAVRSPSADHLPQAMPRFSLGVIRV